MWISLWKSENGLFSSLGIWLVLILNFVTKFWPLCTATDDGMWIHRGNLKNTLMINSNLLKLNADLSLKQIWII